MSKSVHGCGTKNFQSFLLRKRGLGERAYIGNIFSKLRLARELPGIIYFLFFLVALVAPPKVVVWHFERKSI
jgi:hypothetical protein